MLTAPNFSRRISGLPWARTSRRFYARGREATNGSARDRLRSKSKVGETKHGAESGIRYTPPAASESTGPSLIEQLFPERYGAGGTHRDEVREVSKLPLEEVNAPPPQPSGRRPREADRARRMMEVQPPTTAVLVLRNAGKTLTEEDFRRVIPQGEHMEGWTLEEGDILRAIPGRDLQTLEPTGFYFLLFSSPLSAFTYQGHVSRIHRVVAAHSPKSLLSPIAPPPGCMLQGMDAHDAISSFTLVPPDQSLQLRQLKPPLSPTVHSIVQHGGYPVLLQRKDRMPFEARLTLEGPQMQIPALRHILRVSGRDRGLSWSGNDDDAPKLSKWEPVAPDDSPSPANQKEAAKKWLEKNRRSSRDERQLHTSSEISDGAFSDSSASSKDEQKRRTPQPVYIAGFASEQALQSFVHFWHERPMAWEGAENHAASEEGDVPPIAKVQALW